MKRNLLLLLLVVFGGTALAQSTGRFTIKGIVVDSTNVPLPAATVMLLLPKDSSLVNFGRTDDKGILEFKNLKRSPYLLKISYVGYLPYEQLITPKEGEDTDLGTIPLKILNQDLFEVVIKTARAPLSIKGDTVEYNASSFKVPPGSTVEDLLRRLPGMEVGADGSVRAQGQEVKRVTVDGKRFFGDDPKAATKNLPAEAISKVQVFNGKSEQARLTGIEDGKQEKTLNLELKDSHKKGGFGKATVGGGTDNRVEGKFNYNRFNDKQQFSVLGLGNNTNQTGLSWDDYQDFRGSQSFNWNDDGDFGFSSGGGIRFYTFEDDEQSLTIRPGGQGARGFSRNWAGGANYNYDTKKTKFSSNYFFNQTDQVQDTETLKESILSNNSFRTQDENSRNNLNTNHRGGVRLEQTLDSLNTLVIISNARLGRGSSRYASMQEFFRESSTLATRATIGNDNRFNSFAMGNTALFRHKFAKKGRNFAASLGYNINNTDGEANQSSVNEFFDGGINPRVVNINQNNLTSSLRTQFKGSLLYIEPFAKKFFMETFYNFSLRQDEVDRDVFDVSDAGRLRNTQLSQYYTNDITYNRLGTGVRFSNKGLNLSLGLAALQLDLKGQFAEDQTTSKFSRVSRKFQVLTPNASLNYDLKNNRYLFSNYNMTVEEPPIRDLQPIVDNSNPLFIREGNPNLLPQLAHSVHVGYHFFNPGNFTRFFTTVSYNYRINQIVYNQQVDQNLVTRSRPINISGGENLNAYIDYGFPLVKTKSTLGLNASTYLSKNLIYINDILNKTQTNGYRFGTNLSLTPNEKFTFYANADINVSNTKYSLNTSQNQQIINNTYGGEMNVKLPSEMYFSGRFNLNTYVNDRFGFNRSQPILNLSVYKIFLKNKKGEVRLSAYDVFNQNQGIRQFASQNFVTTEQVNTLARYFMLSFTYNMRGITAKIRREGY